MLSLKGSVNSPGNHREESKGRCCPCGVHHSSASDPATVGFGCCDNTSDEEEDRPDSVPDQLNDEVPLPGHSHEKVKEEGNKRANEPTDVNKTDPPKPAQPGRNRCGTGEPNNS